MKRGKRKKEKCEGIRRKKRQNIKGKTLKLKG
jgi:hypothetical protein